MKPVRGTLHASARWPRHFRCGCSVVVWSTRVSLADLKSHVCQINSGARAIWQMRADPPGLADYPG